MTIRNTATAFALAAPAGCHNAKTDGRTYRLHGHAIAWHADSGAVHFHWHGWYTNTTANHMNAILTALHHEGMPLHRVSRADHRDRSILGFVLSRDGLSTIPVDSTTCEECA